MENVRVRPLPAQLGVVGVRVQRVARETMIARDRSERLALANDVRNSLALEFERRDDA
jgi:hypothetical protein